MSWRPTAEPEDLSTLDVSRAVEPKVAAVIEPRDRDLGGFIVRRLLPAAEHRALGPYVFFDHFGPTRFAPCQGLDVRPHPHINLATVTYLFDGEIVHRDSLGSQQAIRPGDINWMTAGRGIVHSERTSPELRASGSSVHGIQLWVGLPRADEETVPAFHHHPGATLPVLRDSGVEIRVLVGEAFGQRSPVRTFSRLAYADVRLAAGASLDIPADGGQRGIYVVEGGLTTDDKRFAAARLLLLHAGQRVRLHADAGCRFVLLSGEPFPEPRHLYWNFASSSPERIEQAKRAWRERRGDPDGPFPLVPGDEREFIPLPA
jgi:redox-sensitive bicupin YhaK (pirin superfamily)